MNNHLHISIITVVILTVNSFSQQKLNLQDVIILAQSQSLSSKKVTNAFENKYWRFNSYKKSFLPSVTFNGTLPNLNIGISEITLQDGTSKFVRTSQVNYSASLLVNQPIKWTGGNVFVSGYTLSLNFPLNTWTGAYTQSILAGRDAFVLCFLSLLIIHCCIGYLRKFLRA